MRASSSAMVAARRQPWPSPSYTWRSTVRRGARASRSRLRGAAPTVSAAPWSSSTGTRISRASVTGERSRYRSAASGSGPTSRR